MYLDEIFNNFLGTLQHAPDIRIDNPGLEQGKFVNDRARYYAGKIVPTTMTTADGECKAGTITMQKPDLELIERSSGPEYGTVMEGFMGGSIIEGIDSGGGSTSSPDAATQAADYAAYDALSAAFTAKTTAYTSALKEYNTFIQSYAYAQYLDKYVKLQTRAAVPATGTVSEVPAVFDTYYINKYGFRYKLPAVAPPADITPSPPADTSTIPVITATEFAKFPMQSATYVVSSGQRLNLAGTIAKYAPDVPGGQAVYVWIDIEGIAHTFASTILSDTVNNCDASCWAKKSAMPAENSFVSLALFTIAMGGSAMIGAPITKATNIACIELPRSVVALKTELNAMDANLRVAASKLRMTHNNHSRYYDSMQQANAIQTAEQSAQAVSSGMTEYWDIKKNMITYEGKVDDSGLNVKSKLGYYVLWVSLMIFVVVVTFRNIANSDSTESGSFMISSALLIILMIYLFNYLSEFRLGPQQLLSKATGDLPEKVSGMMKFTFT